MRHLLRTTSCAVSWYDEGTVKFRDVRRRLRDAGWVIVRQDGSHEQWKHPSGGGRVTVAGHDNREVPPKTLRSIFLQAGWER